MQDAAMKVSSNRDDAERNLANPLDYFLGYQLRRASAAMLADLTRSLADLELRPADASVILLIESNPAISHSEIGRSLGIQRANMAPLAAALIDRGIVVREHADGRSHALRLSDRGQELAQLISARISAHEARFLPDLSDGDRCELIDLLQRIWR